MASAAKCILGLGMAGAIAGTMLYASMPEKKRRHLKNNDTRYDVNLKLLGVILRSFYNMPEN